MQTTYPDNLTPRQKKQAWGKVERERYGPSRSQRSDLRSAQAKVDIEHLSGVLAPRTVVEAILSRLSCSISELEAIYRAPRHPADFGGLLDGALVTTLVTAQSTAWDALSQMREGHRWVPPSTDPYVGI
jgi:hypothetical protein